jgi:hypothetical protein
MSGLMKIYIVTEPGRFNDRRLTRLSREEIFGLLQSCHWIPAAKGIGGIERELVFNLERIGALRKSRDHFSGREPRKHLQRVDQQPDGTWLLSFDNGKRKWSHTLGPPVRK